MAKKRIQQQASSSGATGGAAAGAGLNYQVDFAILQALELISRVLVNPLEDAEITMEPRIIQDHLATRWDVSVSHPMTFTEAKLKPNRGDILEWLDRVGIGIQTAGAQFQLFYGRGAGRVLAAVERLSRIAEESGGNSKKFAELIALEKNDECDEVLKRVKDQPHNSLRRVQLVPFDQNSLMRDIRFRLRYLLQESDRQRFYDSLFRQFHKGLEARITFQIKSLITEAKASGIEFHAPPNFDAQRLDPIVAGAIFILQACELGLPAGVISSGVGCTDEQLERSLIAYGKIFTHENGLWALIPLEPRLTQHDGPNLLPRALHRLLAFIDANRQARIGWRQVPNAIALAKMCQSKHPELVASLYGKLDKLLKRAGNKRLVLEIANLSIMAARRPNRTEQQAKGEAVALICGRSWVYQRIGRLDEARVEGEKSLKIGNELEWSRNTAYCFKCIGRLYRMEAVQNKGDRLTFKTLLRLSVESFEKAIELFPKVTELTERDRDAELGDCYSLLGRTYLVGNDLERADSAVRNAVRHISDPTSKDYADLQILLGDLEVARGQTAKAVARYDEAIQLMDTADAEKSEIAARALFQKGVATGATFCFGKAAEIWERLEESENANEARWQQLIREPATSQVAVAALQSESASVRLEVMRIHDERLSSMTGAYRGRRQEPGSRYWKSLVVQAKRNTVIRRIDW